MVIGFRTHDAEATMHDLLIRLIDERGAIRLAVDLALAIGSLAVLVAWAAATARDRRR